MTDEPSIKAVIGLGNPTEKYVDTRHNIGFMLIDSIVLKAHKKTDYLSKYNALYQKIRIGGRTVYFVKPQTFMNLSGESVACLCRKEKINSNELLIVHDDLDLPLGKLRFKKGGTSAGHNGIESIISNVGRSDFNRLRVGIGRTENKLISDFVLSKFEDDEKRALDEVIRISTAAILYSVHRGTSAAMNEYNGYKMENNQS